MAKDRSETVSGNPEALLPSGHLSVTFGKIPSRGGDLQPILKMDSLTLKSPAKLNLYLRVRRKRPDGHHDIETLFERIDLADTVTLRKSAQGIALITDHPTLPTDRRNLAYQAAELFFRRVGQRKKKGQNRGVRIRLRKRIPIGSGMGGGSSNAATVLLGINRLYGSPLSQKALLGLGRHLGADIPFFLLQKPFAWGRQRGDILTPFSSRLRITHLVVVPRVTVSTKGVYQGLRIALTKKGPNVKIFEHLLREDDLSGLIEKCYNVLETSAAVKYPAIRRARTALEAVGLQRVTLSGSGATLFGFPRSVREAQRFRKTLLSQRNWDIFICKTF